MPEDTPITIFGLTGYQDNSIPDNVIRFHSPGVLYYDLELHAELTIEEFGRYRASAVAHFGRDPESFTLHSENWDDLLALAAAIRERESRGHAGNQNTATIDREYVVEFGEQAIPRMGYAVTPNIRMNVNEDGRQATYMLRIPATNFATMYFTSENQDEQRRRARVALFKQARQWLKDEFERMKQEDRSQEEARRNEEIPF